MDDLGFGLWVTVIAMGVVFGMLGLLMAILAALTALDRRASQAPAAERRRIAQAARTDEGTPAQTQEFTEQEIAAITVAVITHARIRRMQAAPAMRTHEPGSHLFASRWVAVGRAYQGLPWRRDK